MNPLNTNSYPFNNSLIENNYDIDKNILSHFLQNENGVNSLHDFDTFKNALPLLEKLELTNLIKILLYHDVNDLTPLHDLYIFEIAIPLLEKLKPSDLVQFFLLQDENEKTPLHDLYIFEKAMPLLDKLELDDLIKVFLHCDANGQTPLHDLYIFDKAIPLLDKLKPSDFVQFFLLHDEEGKTPLHDLYIFERAISLLDKLELTDLKKVFLHCDDKGMAPLHDLYIFEKALPLLNKLEPSELLVFFQFPPGIFSPLYDENIFKCSLYILKKINPNDLHQIFFNLSAYESVLHNVQIFKEAMPLLKTLESSILYQLLVESSWITSIIMCPFTFKEALPLLEKFDPADLFTILLHTNELNRSPLHELDILKMTLPLLRSLPSSALLEIFSLKNQYGLFSFRYYDHFMTTLPLLEKLKPNDLHNLFGMVDASNFTFLHHIASWLLELNPAVRDRLLSMQDDNGNTILHHPIHYKTLAPFLTQIDFSLLHIRNNEGFTAEEWNTVQLSKRWLVKDKTDFIIPTESEYKVKAEKLCEDINKLWDSLDFDPPNISREYLLLNIANESKMVDPQDILAALNDMTVKILNKTAWLGTPPMANSKELHCFYSQMLLNFEQLTASLKKEKNPSKIAGTLIGIAKVKLENRCAAAYQVEIDQAKMHFSNLDECEEEAFNRCAQLTLLEFIQDLVQSKYGGSSHALSQILYSVGMAGFFDPLPMISIERAQHKIIKILHKLPFMNRFKKAIEKLGMESVQNWFMQHVPNDYGQSYLELEPKIKALEKSMFADAKKNLKKAGLKEFEKIVELFATPSIAALWLNNPKKISLNKETLEILEQASNQNEVEAAEEMFYNNYDKVRILQDRVDEEKEKFMAIKAIEIQKSLHGAKGNAFSSLEKEAILKEFGNLDPIRILRRDILLLQKERILAVNEFKALKAFTLCKIELEKRVKSIHPEISLEHLKAIVEEKRTFDSAIKSLASTMELDFVPENDGLPSNSLKRKRKQAYAEDCFDIVEEKLRVNKKGILTLLLHIGVFEKT